MWEPWEPWTVIAIPIVLCAMTAQSSVESTPESERKERERRSVIVPKAHPVTKKLERIFYTNDTHASQYSIQIELIYVCINGNYVSVTTFPRRNFEWMGGKLLLISLLQSLSLPLCLSLSPSCLFASLCLRLIYAAFLIDD